MFLRPPLHNFLLSSTIIRHRSFSLSSYKIPINSSEVWISKALFTSFLLAPHSIDHFHSLNLPPYVAFLAIKRTKDQISAFNLFNLTRQKLGINHSVDAYKFVITSFCWSGCIVDAVKLFDEMLICGLDSSDENFVGFLIESCVVSGYIDSAMKLISVAQDCGFQINPCRYNNIMSGLINTNRLHDAISFFKEQMVLNRFTPDIWSFNVVLKALCKLGEIKGAQEMFDKMRKIGYSPDRVTYNILIDGLCKAKQVYKAYQVLQMFQSKGQNAPNVITYTTIISGYCKIGKMDHAHKVFDEMIDYGIKPTQVTYNILIDGYSKAGSMKLAVQMYDKMLLSGIRPDIITITSLINGYCINGQLDKAMELWHDMGINGLRPNLYTFSIMIHSLCKLNRLEEAIQFLNQLIERRDLIPKPFVYNPVLDGLCRIGKVDEANSILAQLEKNRGFPDKYSYTILIIGHCMKGRMNEAIEIFGRMKNKGCEIDSVTTRCLVTCLLKAGLPNEADRIIMCSLEGNDRSNSSNDFCVVRKGIDDSVTVN
ncbi:hypothetical protein LUZ60_017574 [Juncus effusus]|nr:hypothetical protein LUZ60_017574 [Juncus effusus]